MIRMISGSTRIGNRTYTSASGAFHADPIIEQRLVALGAAEYIDRTEPDEVETDVVETTAKNRKTKKDEPPPEPDELPDLGAAPPVQ